MGCARTRGGVRARALTSSHSTCGPTGGHGRARGARKWPRFEPACRALHAHARRHQLTHPLAALSPRQIPRQIVKGHSHQASEHSWHGLLLRDEEEPDQYHAQARVYEVRPRRAAARALFRGQDDQGSRRPARRKVTGRAVLGARPLRASSTWPLVHAARAARSARRRLRHCAFFWHPSCAATPSQFPRLLIRG